MSTTRRTPGQWFASHDGHGGLSIETKDGRQICFVRNEADANLIAAAPDMADALQFILKEIVLKSGERAVIEAALLKAGCLDQQTTG